ncbi:putative G-I-Y Y-I-G endonuclease [Stenotrophomonas phage Mendera]|uniref:Putative G-I-Y Y-I-G endonuclease n=1 Tax=Stenotrophomonas phage Mendera TaxID=2650877 RepID=A0A5P8PJ42_9CAUD|nr:NAD synthetase [Stenotrophomonas phage Mendera]QFR56747.1 putative G-I-Y Y-I-G endonuclease [Stenotrophomonas phage Mendera]
MARKKQVELEPWTFNGKPFTQEMVGKLEGFVYLITDRVNGKMYIGKKFFGGMRKAKGAKRRSKIVSDWEKYFGSNDEIKRLVKEEGPQRFKREILSLHQLKRDVNFCEIREQWKRDVLEAVDANGERLYYNENINGKHFPYLVIGWRDRSQIDPNV